MAEKNAAFTPLGKFMSLLMIVGLIAVGSYVTMRLLGPPKSGSGSVNQPTTGSSTDGAGAPLPDLKDLALVDAETEVPTLDLPATYVPKDNIVDIELSEYAGYAGLIVANGGLAPTEDSVFFKKHGFKVKISLSEEESWSALNSGKMAASATTVDVLAVYGRQFQVVVPAQIGFSRGADGIVVAADIKRINNLKGRVVAASQFTEAEFFLRYLAQEAGIGVNVLTELGTPPDADKINLVFCADAFGAGDLFLSEIQSGKSRLAGCVTWDPKTTEVVEASGGKARLLTTNRNLLIVADIMVVNKGFAEQNPAMVAGLVEGLLDGNRMCRDEPEKHLATIATALEWTPEDAREELTKVHLSNLPESTAFFSGAIDAAGSFGGIFQSAVFAYGPGLIKDPPVSERFLDLSHLKAIDAAGMFAGQTILIAPIKTTTGTGVEVDPLLTKDIRFYFQPNSAELDMTRQENTAMLESIKRLLQVSPGSTVLLRGHVDNALIETFRAQGGESFVRQMSLKAVELSKNRAASVMKLLAEKLAVDPLRVETIGRGWEEPASADSEQNRRVEVQWFTVE